MIQPFKLASRTRSHYDELEILFTAEGETADEYIIDEIKNHPHPQQETVVTSDKKLAWHVRHCSGPYGKCRRIYPLAQSLL